jgi:cupin domain protein
MGGESIMSRLITNNFETRRYHLADVAKEGDIATRTPIYSTASTSGVVWVLKPGQEIKPHGHAKADDIWICIQGKGVFYPTPNEERPITKGDVIVSVKGMCHGMKNTGMEDFIFVGILAPVPADYFPIEG